MDYRCVDCGYALALPDAFRGDPGRCLRCGGQLLAGTPEAGLQIAPPARVGGAVGPAGSMSAALLEAPAALLPVAPARRGRAGTYVAAGFALVAVGIGAVVVYRNAEPPRRERPVKMVWPTVDPAPFAGHLGEYLRVTADPGPDPQAPPGRGGGKMVVIDTNTRAVEAAMQAALPDDLRAASPDDVSTVVHVSKARKLAGSYGYESGPAAFKEIWTVTVIDLETHRPMGTHEVAGEPPPGMTRMKSGDADRTGEPPILAVRSVLQRYRRGAGG